jgi:hypothetical protein
VIFLQKISGLLQADLATVLIALCSKAQDFALFFWAADLWIRLFTINWKVRIVLLWQQITMTELSISLYGQGMSKKIAILFYSYLRGDCRPCLHNINFNIFRWIFIHNHKPYSYIWNTCNWGFYVYAVLQWFTWKHILSIFFFLKDHFLHFWKENI